MKLFTAAIEKALRKAGPHGETAVCKFFGGNYTYVAFGSEVVDGDEILYGCACIDGMTQCANDTYGTVLRSELESLRVRPFNTPLERDKYFAQGSVTLSMVFQYFNDNDTLAGI